MKIIDEKNIIFTTARLIVRKLIYKDSDSFFDMQSNPSVMKYVKKHMSKKESDEELRRFIDFYDDETQFFNIWAIIDNNQNRFLGICGVYLNNYMEYELAIRLREQYWGQGYGKEIARHLISHCFTLIDNTTELVAYVDSRNSGSIKILENQMQLIKEFYSNKTKTFEKLYRVKRDNESS
ncbi:GNAT family N-acetyltransferase [Yeosuana marina]|uniref:GNAT family N-acetyltransferase n=1 Tax=Yeosuana marina TaxID=1565536 RepID=UPI00141E1067|nr:GNAT family N-acetyltransferase [Yeosuana marina]